MTTLSNESIPPLQEFPCTTQCWKLHLVFQSSVHTHDKHKSNLKTALAVRDAIADERSRIAQEDAAQITQGGTPILTGTRDPTTRL
jgi:hypothetical protein